MASHIIKKNAKTTISVHQLEMSKAHDRSIELMNLLDSSKAMDFELPERERKAAFSTEYLFGDARGKMLGVLVCADEQGREIVLKAFSSQYNGFWNIPGWVPPVLNAETFTKIVTPVDAKIKDLDRRINAGTDKTAVKELRNTRRALSTSLTAEIQELYQFKDFAGDEYSLRQLWENAFHESATNRSQGIPGGTGDCCAPKLLNYAARNNLVPISLAEFYYGKENASATKKHRVFYAPCKEKCAPLLKTLAPGLFDSGLTVYYKDKDIAVVEKPSGLLSVPGKGPGKLDSVSYRITRLFPESIPQPAAHRLDMATSGIMVFGLTEKAHRNLSIQFQKRQVYKRYIAVLIGIPENLKYAGKTCSVTEGRIELPFRLDPDNRPYQVYDKVYGKMGKTKWRLLSIEENPSGPRARIEFIPETGRTHQLRLHAAHPKGLGCPIAGDKLYGEGDRGGHDPRLLLHAEYLEFEHPETGKRMEFHSPPGF